MSEFEAARALTVPGSRPAGGSQIQKKLGIPADVRSSMRDVWLNKMHEYVVKWCQPDGIPRHIDARKVWRLLSRSDPDVLQRGANTHQAWAEFKPLQRKFVNWMEGKTHWRDGHKAKDIPDFGGPEALIAMIILGGNGQYPACWKEQWAKMKIGHVIQEIGSCPVDPFWEGARFESPAWRKQHCKISRRLSITEDVRLPNEFLSKNKRRWLGEMNDWVRTKKFFDNLGQFDEVFNVGTHSRPRPTNFPAFRTLSGPAADRLPASSATVRGTILDSPASSGSASRKRQRPVTQLNENNRPTSPRSNGQADRRPGSHSAPRLSAPANPPGQRAPAGSPALTSRRSPTVASTTSLAPTARASSTIVWTPSLARTARRSPTVASTASPALTAGRTPPVNINSPLATQTRPARRSRSPRSRIPQPQRLPRVDEHERRPASNARSVTAPQIERKPVSVDLDSDVEEVKPSLEMVRRARKASEEKVMRQYLTHLNEYKTREVVDLVGYLNALPPSFWEQKITAAVVKECEDNGPKRCKYKWRTHLRMIKEMFQDLEYLDDNYRLVNRSVPKLNTDLVWDEQEA